MVHCLCLIYQLSPGSGRMFFSLIGLFRPNNRGLTKGSLVSVEHKSQIFFRANRKFGWDLGIYNKNII